MNKHVAYAFKSPLSLREIKQRLVATTPWPWLDRDNDRYGDYLSALALPEWGMLKVFEEDGTYVLDFKYRSDKADEDAQAEWRPVHDMLVDRVLPSLGAREVAPTEPFD